MKVSMEIIDVTSRSDIVALPWVVDANHFAATRFTDFHRSKTLRVASLNIMLFRTEALT